ncbi:MAG: all-trans-retinol 13,14-reductase [Marinilabiliales bacterium]|nr:MAG: all-trans-retinol 13,14-reductase [Marinilabiliales bacterium]
MKNKSVLIIGSGLSGLLSGYILSKEGFQVTILEKHFQIGGCLQTFKRNGCIFDTGFHYVGGLDKGQNLYRFFKYFDLIDRLKLKPQDEDFDQISFYDGSSYWFRSGYEAFIDRLSADFPDERKSIQRYIHKIREMSDAFPLYNLRNVGGGYSETHLFQESIADYMYNLTSNDRLMNVLAGTNPLYAGVPEKSPMYIHSLINNSNIESSWRLVDGSQQVADRLVESIESYGGKVRASAEVKRLVVKEKRVTAVELADGEILEADSVISSIHPVRTLEMIGKDKIRNAYRSRINSLENTISSFVVYVVFKPNRFKYLNYNTYHYTQDSVWITKDYKESEWPQGYLFLTPAVSSSDQFAECASIISFMDFREVKKWENTSIGRRGEEYEAFKRYKAEILLNEVEKKFPGFKDSIKTYYTSSPLTYRDYTGTEEGSIYGILKDSKNIMKTLILPRTKIKNLFLTGQNTNVHGILGVTIGSVLTCGEFVDVNYLIDKIRKAAE